MSMLLAIRATTLRPSMVSLLGSAQRILSLMSLAAFREPTFGFVPYCSSVMFMCGTAY